jgi:hypothetical protein
MAEKGGRKDKKHSHTKSARDTKKREMPARGRSNVRDERSQ